MWGRSWKTKEIWLTKKIGQLKWVRAIRKKIKKQLQHMGRKKKLINKKVG